MTFDDEELEAVALDSVRAIDIDQFAPADSVPWIFHDSPYYVTPNDKVGEEAFAVIRDAMAAKKVVGISRVVLFRRERAVMLQPRGQRQSSSGRCATAKKSASRKAISRASTRERATPSCCA